MMLEGTAKMTGGQIQAVRAEEQSLSDVIEQARLHAAEREEIHAPDPRLSAHALLALLRASPGPPTAPCNFPDAQRTAELLISVLWDSGEHAPPTATRPSDE